MTRNSSRAPYKVCSACKKPGLRWHLDEGIWTLIDPDGAPHKCRKKPEMADYIYCCARIAERLNGTFWRPDTLNDIADILRQAGYVINEPKE